LAAAILSWMAARLLAMTECVFEISSDMICSAPRPWLSVAKIFAAFVTL